MGHFFPTGSIVIKVSLTFSHREFIFCVFLSRHPLELISMHYWLRLSKSVYIFVSISPVFSLALSNRKNSILLSVLHQTHLCHFPRRKEPWYLISYTIDQTGLHSLYVSHRSIKLLAWSEYSFVVLTSPNLVEFSSANFRNLSPMQKMYLLLHYGKGYISSS